MRFCLWVGITNIFSFIENWRFVTMKLESLTHKLATAFHEALRLRSFKSNLPRILPMLTVYPLLAVLLGSWLVAGIFTIGMMLITDYTLRRYQQGLEERIKADINPTWDVEINQVKVGAITDADYAAIRLRIFSDTRTYYAHAMMLLRVALNSLSYSFLSIPIGLFWIGFAIALVSPESYTDVATAIQHATASEIKQAATSAISLLTVVILLVFSFSVFDPSRFGYINRFEEAVDTEIRKHCSVPTEGKIILSRWTSEGIYWG